MKGRATHTYARARTVYVKNVAAMRHSVRVCPLRGDLGRSQSHAALEAVELAAAVLGVGDNGGGRDHLHVVSQVRARAATAEAVLGAVPRPRRLGKARVAPKAAHALRADAAAALDDPHDDAVALVDKRVVVVAEYAL